jgi:hypothetical protein
MGARTGAPDLKAISQGLADNGKLIEAGWVGLQLKWVPADAGPEQRREMRQAFFAGAQHLFASIMEIMTEDREPTAADFRRMAQIDAELRAFAEELLSALPTEGRP